MWLLLFGWVFAGRKGLERSGLVGDVQGSGFSGEEGPPCQNRLLRLLTTTPLSGCGAMKLSGARTGQYIRTESRYFYSLLTCCQHPGETLVSWFVSTGPWSGSFSMARKTPARHILSLQGCRHHPSLASNGTYVLTLSRVKPSTNCGTGEEEVRQRLGCQLRAACKRCSSSGRNFLATGAISESNTDSSVCALLTRPNTGRPTTPSCSDIEHEEEKKKKETNVHGLG